MKDTDNILFHDFKHHIQSNVQWLSQNAGKWNPNLELQLKSIGSSQLDYYTGHLTLHQIKEQINTILANKNVLKKEDYKKWLNSNNGYQEALIKDGSTWTLREINKKKFVHIHPSRYSKHTIRIKANTLKTVLCTLLLEDTDLFKTDIRTINIYRDNYLGLSRIKETTDHSELRNTFKLFIDRLRELK